MDGIEHSLASRQRPRGWRTRTRERITNAMMERAAAKLAVDTDSDEVSLIENMETECSQEDKLGREQDNCTIHLYARGQPSHGPLLKLPLAVLIDAQCQPLLDRCTGSGADNWAARRQTHSSGSVHLYMPPPANANAADKVRHGMATRNFVAWATKGSLVGESMGSAWVDLLRCMDSYRDRHVDNVADLVRYLEQQGLWNFGNRPDQALAALHFAETLGLRDIYVDAFCHCVGMIDRLSRSREYQNISLATQRLLRQGRTSSDLMLCRASAQLGTCLAAELSEAHLGLSDGMRSQLGRFRTFLESFYADRLGSFPPRSSPSGGPAVWEPAAYRTLRTDFEALYDLLVDERFTSSENTPFLAQGGICAMQSVHSFDVQHNMSSLRHPLPLLPEIAPEQLPPTSSPLWPVLAPSTTIAPMPTTKRQLPSANSSSTRRFSRSVSAGLASLGIGSSTTNASGSRPDKLRPDERLVTHAALIKATNLHKTHLLANPLVRAYRRFEEEEACGVVPSMATAAVATATTTTPVPMTGTARFPARVCERERGERISLVDARKVRWILVYAMYQVLRSVTESPSEVRGAKEATYLLPTWLVDEVPTWEDDDEDDEFEDCDGEGNDAVEKETMALSDAPRMPIGSPVIEIKPDIDYMGMYHQQQEEQQQQREQRELQQQHRRPPSTNKCRSLLLQTQFAASATAPSSSRQNSPTTAAMPMSSTSRGSLRRSFSVFHSSSSAPPLSSVSSSSSPLVRGPNRLSSVRRATKKPANVADPTSSGVAPTTLAGVGRRTERYNEIIVQAYGNGMAAAEFNAPVAMPGTLMDVTFETATTASAAATPAQRTMSTSSNGSNVSQDSATSSGGASCVTALTTAPATPVDETGPLGELGVRGDILVEPHDLPCSAAPGPGLGLGNMPWMLALRAASETPAHSRGSRLSQRMSSIKLSSRAAPSPHRDSWADLPRQAAVHESLLLLTRGPNRNEEGGSPGEKRTRAGTLPPDTQKALPPLPAPVPRTRVRSWREGVLGAEPTDAIWTIVSPSLGGGNKCPLELSTDGRAGLGFSGRMSGMA